MDKLLLETGPPSPPFPWEALLAFLPHLVWAGLVVGVSAWIGPDSIRSALKRLSKVEVGGLEFEFREELEAAVHARGKTSAPGDIGRAARRLAASNPIIRGANILWVDDNARNNNFESQILRSAGAHLTLSASTESAVTEASRVDFDLVISDMKRGDQAYAGLELCRRLASTGHGPPVILYVGHARKPIPPEAFGITDRPDELVHLVLDALARQRG